MLNQEIERSRWCQSEYELDEVISKPIRRYCLKKPNGKIGRGLMTERQNDEVKKYTIRQASLQLKRC